MKVVNYRILKRRMKFGIQVPYSVKEALEYDQQNGNTLYHLVISVYFYLLWFPSAQSLQLCILSFIKYPKFLLVLYIHGYLGLLAYCEYLSCYLPFLIILTVFLLSSNRKPLFCITFVSCFL